MLPLWVVIFVSAVATLTLARSAAKKPHLIFILQDDLGRWDIGFNGNGSGSSCPECTGNYTRLAHQGIVLEQHYVHWHCSPSRRTFLTGRLPKHHGEYLSQADTDDIDLRWSWISEKLKAQGYVGHWYGKGHTGYKSMAHLPANASLLTKCADSKIITHTSHVHCAIGSGVSKVAHSSSLGVPATTCAYIQSCFTSTRFPASSSRLS